LRVCASRNTGTKYEFCGFNYLGFYLTAQEQEINLYVLLGKFLCISE